MEEGANVNKLTKLKTFGENSSQKLFRFVKQVNKLECSKNLSSTICLDVSSVQIFVSFFLFVLIIGSISLSKCTTSLVMCFTVEPGAVTCDFFNL